MSEGSAEMTEYIKIMTLIDDKSSTISGISINSHYTILRMSEVKRVMRIRLYPHGDIRRQLNQVAGTYRFFFNKASRYLHQRFMPNLHKRTPFGKWYTGNIWLPNSAVRSAITNINVGNIDHFRMPKNSLRRG